MTGAILQLVANNGPQNQWIDHDPQITWFKTVFRRHTPFSREMIEIPFDNKLDFGKTATANILRKGDLVYRGFVTFDLPELRAGFPNTKTQDIYHLIRNTVFSDPNFSDNLKLYNNQTPEIANIMKIIDDAETRYETEKTRRLNILSDLDKYHDTVEINGLTNPNNINDPLFLEKDNFVMDGITKNVENEKFNKFFVWKMALAKPWLNNKKEYLPIYELIKFMYLSQYDLYKYIPLISTHDINNKILIPYIFSEILPSPEIFQMYHDKYHPGLENISNNFDSYLKNISNNDTARFFSTKKLISHSKCDTHMATFTDDFAQDFYTVLGTYNTIINALKSLGKTVPIVIIKPFLLNDPNANIYIDRQTSGIDSTKFATIIDPNFQRNFLQQINNMDMQTGKEIASVDYNSMYDQVYSPSENNNIYLKFFNMQALQMFNNIRSSMDRLFETYRGELFKSTSQLFYLNSPPLTNIYSYFVPVNGAQDSTIVRPYNVFNANIFLFYYFKYLDLLDARVFSEYLQNTSNLTSQISGFLEKLLTLVKININYYMNEISYLLNDLYSKNPSANPQDTFKNYTPIASAPTINGYNINRDILAVTMIFHRNHVPSILEIFEFIYGFIDNISLEKLNEYLATDINIDDHDIMTGKNILKILYQEIFKYFMNIYDDFKFENSANYQPDGSKYSVWVQNYVKHFLLNSTNTNIEQPSIAKYLPQMEFYFVSEMINMRETQKFYYNVLENQDLIAANTDISTLHILNFITEYFYRIDDNQQKNHDNVKEYWDVMFHHNINSRTSDKLYYNTYSLQRYYGNPYINTSYNSRFFGRINEPLENPLNALTNPFGVNPNFYDNNNTKYLLEDEIPVNWTSQNIQTRETPIDRNFAITTRHAVSRFKMYPLDFFRIKHEILHQQTIPIDQNIKFVDEYQFNLLAAKLISKDVMNKNISLTAIPWLPQILQHLIKNTDPKIDYIDNTGQHKNFVDEFANSLEDMQEIAENNNEKLSLIASKILSLSTEMFNLFNRGIIIKNSDQSAVYNADMLLENNRYTLKHVLDYHFNNIIYAITLLRDNFISQYFYYKKHQPDIENIDKNRIKGDTLAGIISDITQKSLIDMSLIYPEFFIGDIQNIYENNNDFIDSIVKFLYPIKNPENIKMTMVDLKQYINMIYSTTFSLYNYLLENNLYNTVYEKFSYYQPMMLNKISIVQEMADILQKQISDIDKYNLINEIATKYEISTPEFLEWLHNILQTEKNVARRLVLLQNGLDYFILSKNFPAAKKTFKQQILSELNTQNLSQVVEYIKWIDNRLLPYVCFYLEFAYKNKINYIDDPLRFSTNNEITGNLSNGLEFLMDALFNKIISVNDTNDYFDLQKTFTEMANIIQKSTNKPENVVDDIVTVLSGTNDPMVFQNLVAKIAKARSPNTDYLDDLQKKSKILDTNKELVAKGILQIQQQLNELHYFKDQLIDIIYRNDIAHCAWIKKLAHYLVKSATLISNNETIDLHISDWFEVFQQISQYAGLNDAYDRMTGNITDLTDFSTAPKKSHTIILPLIFYSNKYITHALPLIAARNMQHQIKIELRNIDDVAFKDQFSQYMDANGNVIIPKINNAKIMFEYFYLSNDERKIFMGKNLEYLIDEIQIDNNISLNDKNLIPLYKIKNTGANNQNIYLDQQELSKYDGMHLLLRDDHVIVPYRNRNGITQWIMKNEPIVVDPKIQAKRFRYKYHFNNPTKMLAVLVRPEIHIDPSLRRDNRGYFYGEKQWNNYGLYSRYNLDKINKAKKENYEMLQSKLNDLDDPDFGILNILNHLLLDSSENDPETAYIQEIKEAYLQYTGVIFDNSNLVRIKNFLYHAGINFGLPDFEKIREILDNIYNHLQIDIPNDQTIIKNIGIISGKSESMDRNNFTLLVDRLMTRYIENGMVSPLALSIAVNKYYNRYNYGIIDELIDRIDNSVGLNNYTTGIKYPLMQYLKMQNIDAMTQTNLEMVLEKLNDDMINKNIITTNTDYLDVIQQLSNFTGETLNTIAKKINNKLNQLIDNYKITQIDYMTNLVPNPEVNPILSSQILINEVAITPINWDSKLGSQVSAYTYLKNIPEIGINLHIWAIDVLSSQPSGSINLNAVSDITGVYNLHPLIGNNYPASMVVIANSINIIRYLSGMSGKAWI